MRNLNLKAFARRIKNDNFCYGTFTDKGKVCWLTSLVGTVIKASDIHRSGGFYSLIPLWADCSQKSDHKENANLLLGILEREHTDLELETIDGIVRQVRSTRLCDGYDWSKLQIASLFAANEVSKALISMRK